jgi:hypothetical protein
MITQRGTIRPCGKRDLRIRIPAWVMKALQDAAIEAGVECKPGAVAAANVLEEWARERERKQAEEKAS